MQRQVVFVFIDAENALAAERAVGLALAKDESCLERQAFVSQVIDGRRRDEWSLAQSEVCNHRWVILDGVQCAGHYVHRGDFRSEMEWVEAQAPLCGVCHDCKKCRAERNAVETEES